MYRLKQIVLAIILICIANPCRAEESAVVKVFKDVFYGGLSGALVGGVVMAFTKHPGDHLDYIGFGAAGGALVGGTYGAVSAARALAEVKDGKVKFAMPSLVPGVKEGPNGSSAVTLTAQLLRGQF
ncbi:hypothetical protein [Geomonas sp.]|uniref:hypothetical protein n=1 Tax=Geomonas sp. TaxID=2651584 RepID=UPI002B4963F6|nr:hypothetical protein [Geomonas sp.]HJV34714.1 hypothetical protein [Geomonas sp.]